MTDEANQPSTTGNKTNPNRMPKWRRAVAWTAFCILFVFLAMSGTVLGVSALGRSLYQWHGFVIELRLLPAKKGQTSLVLKPLGEVHAHTHVAPVALIASLEQIEIEDIRKLVNDAPKMEELAKEFEVKARASLSNFIFRQIALAAFGGLLAPFLLGCRRLRYYFLGTAIGVLTLGGALGSALSSFNGKAFEDPVYTGAFKQAPWVIQFGKDAFTKFDALSMKLRNVAENLNVLYGRISAVTDRSLLDNAPDTVRVLHVSDIHNNKAALDFMRKVADQFKVDMIVDTGDLTDFGSQPELLMVREVAKLPYPYVFVAGNHDSRLITAEMAKSPRATLLDGQVAEVKGLKILGLPNPASLRDGNGNVDADPAAVRTNGERLRDLIAGMKEKPDIIALHDPKEAQALWGFVPLILCGHMHAQSLTYEVTPPVPLPPGMKPEMRTTVCNAGTTGAAGLRYFEGNNKSQALSCAVLTFRRANPAPPNTTPGSGASAGANAATTPASPTSPTPNAVQPVRQNPEVNAAQTRLVAVDLIVLDGSLGTYSISHTSY